MEDLAATRKEYDTNIQYIVHQQQRKYTIINIIDIVFVRSNQRGNTNKFNIIDYIFVFE